MKINSDTVNLNGFLQRLKPRSHWLSEHLGRTGIGLKGKAGILQPKTGRLAVGSTNPSLPVSQGPTGDFILAKGARETSGLDHLLHHQA